MSSGELNDWSVGNDYTLKCYLKWKHKRSTNGTMSVSLNVAWANNTLYLFFFNYKGCYKKLIPLLKFMLPGQTFWSQILDILYCLYKF